jgi:hypothetical protein
MALSLMRDVLLIAARVVTAGHLVGAWSGVIRPAHPHAGFAIGQQRLPIPFPLNPILLSQDMQEHGNRHRYPPNGGRAITRMPNPKRGRSRSPHARRSRELRRNAATRGGTLHYRAVVAQWKAEPADVSSKGQQARRQRPAARVCAGPAVRCVDRPGSTSPMMSRCGSRTRRSTRPFTFGDVGAPRRELTACLRTGRALRVPRVRTRRRARRRLPEWIPPRWIDQDQQPHLTPASTDCTPNNNSTAATDRAEHPQPHEGVPSAAHRLRNGPQDSSSKLTAQP